MSWINRRVLPQRRYTETFDMPFGKMNTVYTVSLGRYRNGDIGEVFVSGPKAGSEMDAIARDSAILLSLAIQHGVPLATIRHALTRDAQGVSETIVGKIVDRIA